MALPPSGHKAEHFELRDNAQLRVGDRHRHRHYHNYEAAPTPSRFYNKHFDLPRGPSASFTGRDKIRNLLQESCLPSNPSDEEQQQKRFVLYGLGGSGKTQLCLKFAEQYREKFWGVFWVDASSDDSIEGGLSNIGRICGIQEESEGVKRWLSNIPESWLLILDNADDPSLDLSEYFPVGGRGTILISTRNPENKVHATVGTNEPGAMEVEDAVTLLIKTSMASNPADNATREAALSIVQKLGCLALAVNQAGAVIRQGVYSMTEYNAEYDRRRKELLQKRGVQGRADYQYTAYTTWEVSIRAIEAGESHANSDALEILRLFSYFHHEGISEEIFRRAWTRCWIEMDFDKAQPNWLSSRLPRVLCGQRGQQWDNHEYRNAISLLSSFSLISRDDSSLLSIHPLVHAWARDRLGEEAQERAWETAVMTMGVSVPWTSTIADYQYRRYLLRHTEIGVAVYEDGIFHIRMDSRAKSFLAENFADVYAVNDRAHEAILLLERVVEERRVTIGEEHLDTLRSMDNLASRYGEVDRQQDSLLLREKVVGTRRRMQGEEHRLTLNSKQNLATNYSEAGRRQEALLLAEQVLEARKRTLGKEHPDTLNSMHDLGVYYDEAGRQQESLQLDEQVVKVRKRILGDEHPDTLDSMYNLAVALSNAGRYEDSLLLNEQVSEARKRTLGEEHLDTLRSMYNLAMDYGNAGRYHDSLRFNEEVVKVRKRILGDEHPDTLKSMYNLATDYDTVGRIDDSRSLMEQVVEARRRTLGEEHPATLRAINNLRGMCEGDDVTGTLQETPTQDASSSRAWAKGAPPKTKGNSRIRVFWRKLIH